MTATTIRLHDRQGPELVIRRQRAATLLAATVAGLVLWVAALVAVGQYGEDLCFDDLAERSGYDAYRATNVLWPPSYECLLLGSGVESVVVQHRAVALARLAAWSLPWAACGLTAVVVSRSFRAGTEQRASPP